MKLIRTAAIGSVTASFVLINTIPTSAYTLAPNCVQFSLYDRGHQDHLLVINTCSTFQRVKVVIARNPDFPCTHYSKNSYKSYSWGYPGRFDRLESC